MTKHLIAGGSVVLSLAVLGAAMALSATLTGAQVFALFIVVDGVAVFGFIAGLLVAAWQPDLAAKTMAIARSIIGAASREEGQEFPGIAITAFAIAVLFVAFMAFLDMVFG